MNGLENNNCDTATTIRPGLTVPSTKTDTHFIVAGTASALLTSFAMIVCITVLWIGENRAQAAEAAYTTTKPAAAATAAQYTGGNACAGCHAKEFDAWKDSQHDLSMQHASEKSVLGDFNNAKFRYADITSTFFKRDGKFYVDTDGPDGKLHDYEIKYTFGVYPLQQYLIEFPDGRIQALSISWDAHTREQGGQRWFHLYPGESIKAGDRLHWTGIDQNWNYQCADCHSTDLRKNFDAATDTFKTTWSDIDVACESCHGPGAQHVAWANKEGDWRHITGKGLAIALDERRNVTWNLTGGDAKPERSTPRATSREIETCARCHSRRGQLTDDYVFGRPLADTYRPSLLEEGLYWPDGQQRGEVYKYASFLQSAMYAKGVTCSDCHEPHTQKLRAPGNALCAQCHRSAKYDSNNHTHHAEDSAGAQCVSCHMPTTDYMVVDPRHDHSMRIPRPDRSVTMGVPNACNQCHKDRNSRWAATQVRKWYPQPLPGYQKFAEALYAATRVTAPARKLLMAVIEDTGQPAIGRASAAALLANYSGSQTTKVLLDALNDSDPMVRAAAVDALGGAAPEVRAQSLPRLLADPLRLVRISAARALNDVPGELIPADQRAALAKALDEYIATQRFNADRPEAHTNLGTLYAERGQYDQARAEFQQALAIDPAFVPASVNLADLYRSRGDERSVDTTLRYALKRNPGNASLHHSLGLSLVRQKRMRDAIAELKQSARLAPDQPRYAYVYGVALHSTGKQDQGIRVLADAHKRFTGDTDILQALAMMEHERGRRDAALTYARKLAELLPEDPEAKIMLQRLQR
jgi:predicted CXXCH cytochrome family protein